jgi:hypothetical protein
LQLQCKQVDLRRERKIEQMKAECARKGLLGIQKKGNPDHQTNDLKLNQILYGRVQTRELQDCGYLWGVL